MHLQFRNILDYVDLEFDKTVPAFKSNLTASGIWRSDVFIDDRIFVLTKCISQVVHKSIKVATDALRDGER